MHPAVAGDAPVKEKASVAMRAATKLRNILDIKEQSSVEAACGGCG